MTNRVGDPSTSSKLAAPTRLLRPAVPATYAQTRGIEGLRRLWGQLAVRGLTADRNSAPLPVPYCKGKLNCFTWGREGHKSSRTIDRSAIFLSCPQVPWRSFAGALAHRFQSPIRLFEMRTVVFPSIDSIRYLQRPGSVLTTTEGRLHKFVQDAGGLKEDQVRARTLTVVPASGMSKNRNPPLFSLASGRFR